MRFIVGTGVRPSAAPPMLDTTPGIAVDKEAMVTVVEQPRNGTSQSWALHYNSPIVKNRTYGRIQAGWHLRMTRPNKPTGKRSGK